MGDTKYCLCCGEDVPFSVVVRNERKEETCVYCGFTLDVQKLWEKPVTVEATWSLIAEDSPSARKTIEALLKARKFSAHVEAFENGLALISAYSKLVAEKKRVDIAILDLNMPVMDGLTAARTMRAVENQYRAARTPIVFFSAVKADEALKTQMAALEPANYVNKGSDPDPAKLSERLDFLVSHLIEKYRLSR